MAGGTVLGVRNAQEYGENQVKIGGVEQRDDYSYISDPNFMGATAGISAIMFSGFPIWYGMAVRRRED